MKYKYLLFDLDGTLTEPGLGITNSIIYALDKFGIKENDRESLYRFIGPPLMDSFMEFYNFDEEKARKAMGYYREYFSEKGLFENRVYDGIKELLSQLKAGGYRLLVATSKPTEYSLRILDKFELLEYFEYVSGSSLSENNSAKSIIIHNAINALGITEEARSQVLMIGDRHHDIDGAGFNGIDSLAVLYGYGNLEEFKKAGATYIVETVSELGNFLLNDETINQ